VKTIKEGLWKCGRYGLDGPGIESRCGRHFPHPSRPAPGAHPASCTMGTRSFSGVKRLGRGVDYLSPSSVEVKEREQIYFYSPSWSSWSIPGWILPFLFSPLVLWRLKQIYTVYKDCFVPRREQYALLFDEPTGECRGMKKQLFIVRTTQNT
jgi:hypothetical protein